jgi:hypothetical protein
MMSSGANQLNGNTGLDCIHNRLIEAVQVIGKHTDRALLIGAHRG